MTPDASFGPLVVTGSKLQITRQRVRWKAEMTRTGPNDARRVVWALGELFFRVFFLTK